MPKYIQEIEEDDGWTRWVPPIMDGYKMACCDCGLVHEMTFRAVEVTGDFPDGTWDYEPLDPDRYRIILAARRNSRSTGQMRRHMKGEEK